MNQAKEIPHEVPSGFPKKFAQPRELSIIDKKTGEHYVLITTRDIKQVDRLVKRLVDFFKLKHFRSRYIVCWIEDNEDHQTRWLDEAKQRSYLSIYGNK